MPLRLPPVLAAAGVLAAAASAWAGPEAADDAAPAALLVPVGPAFPLHPLPAEGGDLQSPIEAPVAPGAAPGEVVEVEVTPEPAQAAAEPAAAERSGEPMTPVELTPVRAETLAYQMKSYVRQVHERVGRVWVAPVAPPRAPRRQALVTVVIDRGGRVVEARLDRPSSDERFDRSVLRAVDRPNLFPPLPPYYQTDVLEIGLRFADLAPRPRAR